MMQLNGLVIKSGYEMDLKDPETVQIFLESASMGIEGYIPWDGSCREFGQMLY